MSHQGIFIPTEERVKTILKELVNPQFAELKKLINESINPPKRNLTVQETAKRLNVTELTIRNYIKKGTIKAEKIGRRIIINSKDLEKSLSEVKSFKYRR